jgi:hypothetical protein
MNAVYGAELSATGRGRRVFLRLILAGLASGQGLAWQTARAGNHASGWVAWLLAAADRDAVVRLGRSYLVLRPAERDSEVLAHLIDRALVKSTEAAARSTGKPVAAGVLLNTVVQADYSRGDVVQLDGWLLSITEARLYGLVALLAD